MQHAVSPNNFEGADLLSIRSVSKTYGKGDAVTHALNGISLNIKRSEFVAIMGASGSGKTTLLNCVATIDAPTSGQILLDGVDVTSIKGKSLANFRRDYLGFIFQDTNLVETLTGFENISLALTLKNENRSDVELKVNHIADSLGIVNVLSKFPNQMSGGQRQRVAAARAIVVNPRLILADEPTGALDSRNSTIMLKTLEKINRDYHATILMVTHDAYAASYSTRTVFIKDGTVFSEISKGNKSNDTYYNEILNVVTFLGSEASHAI